MNRRRNANPRIPSTAIPPTADPIPIPAFAPLLSPDNADAVAVVVAGGGCDDEVMMDVDV